MRTRELKNIEKFIDIAEYFGVELRFGNSHIYIVEQTIETAKENLVDRENPFCARLVVNTRLVKISEWSPARLVSYLQKCEREKFAA